MQLILCGHIIICLLTFVSSCTLLIGVKKQRPSFVLQWIIVSIICLIIAFATQMIQLQITPERGRSFFIYTLIVFDVFALGNLLFLLLLLSLHILCCFISIYVLLFISWLTLLPLLVMGTWLCFLDYSVFVCSNRNLKNFLHVEKHYGHCNLKIY